MNPIANEFLALQMDELLDERSLPPKPDDPVKAKRIETLIISWRQDPIWDLEHTDGFEDCYKELYAYRMAYEDGVRDALAGVHSRLRETETLGDLVDYMNYLDKRTQ